MLEITNLGLKYKKKIIFNDFSLKTNTTGLVLIKGNSGRGKSTLFYAIYGIKKPSKGTIKVCDFDINKISKFKLNKLKNKIITYVAPEFYFIDELSIKENLILLDIDFNEFIKKTSDLALVIDNFDIKASKLSSGEKAKAAISCALIKNYKVYLFDEIYGSLDLNSKERLKKIIINLMKNSLILLAAQDDLFIDISDEVVNL